MLTNSELSQLTPREAAERLGTLKFPTVDDLLVFLRDVYARIDDLDTSADRQPVGGKIT